MVEQREDNFYICGEFIFKKEMLSWETLKSTLDMHEPPRVERSS